MADDQLRERLAAVERALTDDDATPTEFPEAVAEADDLADLREEFDALRDEVAELQAATQALRGFVGNAVPETSDAAERADRALRRVDELAERLEARDQQSPDTTPDPAPREPATPAEPDTCPACGRDAPDADTHPHPSTPDGGTMPGSQPGQPTRPATEPRDGSTGYPAAEPPADRDPGLPGQPGRRSRSRQRDAGGLVARVRDLV